MGKDFSTQQHGRGHQTSHPEMGWCCIQMVHKTPSKCELRESCYQWKKVRVAMTSTDFSAEVVTAPESFQLRFTRTLKVKLKAAAPFLTGGGLPRWLGPKLSSSRHKFQPSPTNGTSSNPFNCATASIHQ